MAKGMARKQHRQHPLKRHVLNYTIDVRRPSATMWSEEFLGWRRRSKARPLTAKRVNPPGFDVHQFLPHLHSSGRNRRWVPARVGIERYAVNVRYMPDL